MAITAFTPYKYGPLAAQSLDDPDPYSFPAKIIVSKPSCIYFAAASKIANFYPDGIWTVSGPTLSTILLIILALAKVPLTIISSFPLLAPYELKSYCWTPFCNKYLPAGEFLPIFPAGEIWSVVIESPKFNRQ